ncbi:MAG: hypothetical protein DIU80_016795 [Chloroflexota bacterium]|nr:MAG: hypothetical protein DIU80_10350 [Chloroflexota bacterium]
MTRTHTPALPEEPAAPAPPDPSEVPPHATPRTLADALPQLLTPFPIDQVELKPGSVSRDGTSALALAYCDWRLYAERLDVVIGPGHWSVQLVPWGEHRLIARLTILGVTKDASGEGDPSDPNCGTIAEAQAKKRACAEFGLGRYLYRLPRLWGKGEGDRTGFRFAEGEARRLVHEMYARAGLLAPAGGAATRRRELPADAPDTMPPPANTAEEVRARLAEIRSRTGAAGASAAPAREVRMITPRQLALLAERKQLAAARRQYGVTRLEDLTFAQASALITALNTAPRTTPGSAR